MAAAPAAGHELPWHELTRFEKWLYTLRYGKRWATDQALPPELRQEEGIDMAVSELQKVNADRELRQLLEQQEKERHDMASLMANARKAGLAQGLKQGLEKGMDEGVRKGVVLTIRQLVDSGLSPAEVATRLHLTLQDVETALKS